VQNAKTELKDIIKVQRDDQEEIELKVKTKAKRQSKQSMSELKQPENIDYQYCPEFDI
jgi:hypothetical protein